MAQIVMLLQAVVTILSLVQGNPNVTEQDRQAAFSLASAAVEQARAYVAEQSDPAPQPATTTQPTPMPETQVPTATPTVSTPVVPTVTVPTATPVEPLAKPHLTVAQDTRSPAYLDTVYKLSADQPVVITGIVFRISPDEDITRVYPNGIPVRLPDGRVKGQVKTKDCFNAAVSYECPKEPRIFTTIEPITITPQEFRYTELPASGRILSVQTQSEAEVAILQ